MWNCSCTCCSRRFQKPIHPIWRTGLLILATSLGIIASVLMIVAIARVDSMPASYLCHQTGYPVTDCSSPNQSRFDYVYNASCATIDDYSCLDPAPYCCIGNQNINKSYAFATPALTLTFNLYQVSCSDIAESSRAEMKRCGPTFPCIGRYDGGANISDDVLDDYQSLAYEQCVEERLEGGYFLLFFTGPMILFATVVLTFAHCLRSNPIISIGVFLATVAVAVLLKGVSTLANLRYGLGWTDTTYCADKDSSYVIGGKFFGIYACVDTMIGGDQVMSMSYDWLMKSFILYFTGSGLACGCCILFIFLLSTNWGWQHVNTRSVNMDPYPQGGSDHLNYRPIAMGEESQMDNSVSHTYEARRGASFVA